MANHKSAIKRHKQSVQRHLRNQAFRSRVRTLVKKTRVAIESKDRDAIAETIKEVNGLLDKAVLKGVLKRNTASRKMARLARAAHQAVPPESPAETPVSTPPPSAAG